MNEITKLFTRSEQMMFSFFQRGQIFLKPDVVNGSESLLEISNILLEKRITSVLVVTTAGFINRGSLESFFDKLTVNDIKISVFSEVLPDPDIQTVEKAAEIYRQNHNQAIIAIGGGSVMDTAKIAGALVAKPKQTVHQMTGTMKIRKKIPLLFAVPTTAGSGSEISPAAVITDEQTQRKYPITDFAIVPKYVILDPKLLLGLPKDTTANSGMDALTHAIEGYINVFSPRTAKISAKKAITLIFNNLSTTYHQGNDLKARENMLIASFEAGISLSYGNTGYVHAISHGIGGLYHLPHGRINAVLLPQVLREYQPKIEGKLASLAQVIGIQGNNQHELATKFIEQIELLRQSMDMPNELPEIDTSFVQQLAHGAEKEANPAYPVPDIWDQARFEKLLDKIKG
ncbi:iron-containing alcohol dehydrogenase [Leuconostoc sp. JNUCC 76]